MKHIFLFLIFGFLSFANCLYGQNTATTLMHSNEEGELTDQLIITGTATDSIAILQMDNKTPSARNKTWEINVTSGTVKADVSKADVTLSGLPAGLDYTASKGTGNSIVITLTGTATTALTADATVTAIIMGSAVSESNASNSQEILLYLWYVSDATTFVISNEEGKLIDKMIRAGDGDKNMYEILELLKPFSQTIINDRYLETLASNSEESMVFSTNLKDWTGSNNPACINVDGTVLVKPISGNESAHLQGFISFVTYRKGIGEFYITTPKENSNLIDAGTNENGIPYKAFAIAWKQNPDTIQSIVMTNEGGLIDSLIAVGYGDTTVHNVIKMLAPLSGGVITDVFLQNLESNYYYFEEIKSPLKNYGGSNNPICISTNGKVRIVNYFGKDYSKQEGFATYPEKAGADISFTYAISPEYYIDAGYYVPEIQVEDTTFYRVIAIIWKDTTTVGVQERDIEKKIIISPNPARDYIYIHSLFVEGAGSVYHYLGNGWQYQIYDLLGNCVQSGAIESNKININQLSSGFYTVRFFNSGRQVVEKMIKE